MAADGDTVVVAHGGSSGNETRLARSHDGGLTFPEQNLVLVDTRGTMATAVAIEGRRIHVLYGGQDHDVRVARSEDGGDTFTIHSVAQQSGSSSFLVQGDTILLVYEERPDPSASNVQFVRSADGGATWSAPVPISFDVGSRVLGPALVQTGGALVVTAYLRDFDQQGAARSTDGGATWTAAPAQRPLLVATGAPVTMGDAIYLPMVDENGRLVVSESRDAGVTWTERSLDAPRGAFGINGEGQLEGPIDAGALLVARGATLYAMFDEGTRSTRPKRVGFARSTDEGASWPHTTTSFVEPGHGPSDSLMRAAAFAVSGGPSPTLLFAFHDGNALRVLRSTDDGTTWP
jgi:hypothetical protein